MTRRRKGDGAQIKKRGPRHSFVADRAVEVIEWMISLECHTPLTKPEAVKVLADLYGSVWLGTDGKPNKRWLIEAVALMHDQFEYPEVADRLGGFMIEYAPNSGGMTLVGDDGELGIWELAHILDGDLQIQQKAMTVLRRREAGWKVLSNKAFTDGWLDLARVCMQIEREIDARGYVPADLVDDYRRLMAEVG